MFAENDIYSFGSPISSFICIYDGLKSGRFDGINTKRFFNNLFESTYVRLACVSKFWW